MMLRGAPLPGIIDYYAEVFSGLFEFEFSLHGRLTNYALWTNLTARSCIYLSRLIMTLRGGCLASLL